MMSAESRIAPTKIALLLIILVVVFSSDAAQRHTLILNGKSTEAPVIYMNSRPYVGLEALAKALNGSISSSGANVALSLPTASVNQAPSATEAAATPAFAPTEAAPSSPGFSREFLSAGIKAMPTLREWHTTLQTAIETGIPVSEGLLQPYRAQSTTDLHLASVAATTSADRSTSELLHNVYTNMAKLSEKYVEMRARLTYSAPDALRQDDLNKRIINCGHFLGTMAASGHFSDDGSCH